jgi:hypothetical protein
VVTGFSWRGWWIPENKKTPRIREVCAQSGGVTARYPMMMELIADIADE